MISGGDNLGELINTDCGCVAEECEVTKEGFKIEVQLSESIFSIFKD